MRIRSLSFLAVTLLAFPLIAQNKPFGGATSSALIDAMKADAELRAKLAEELVTAKESPGREFPSDYRTMLVNRLKSLTVEQLQERRATGLLLTPDTIGDTSADLTYTPLSAPCRIADTRVAGGALAGGAPGPTRSFIVAGSGNLSAQGGSATGCGVPVGATAVLINFVAVNPQGLGNLRGAAYPNAVPTTGSIVNYQSVNPALNIANGLMFPICDPSVNTCTFDVTLLANGAGTDVVADVLGYSRRFPTERVRTFSVTSSSGATTGLTMTCTNYTGGSITINAPAAGTVHVASNVIMYWAHTAGNNPAPFVYLNPSPTSCSGTSIGLDVTYIGDSSLPTGNYQPRLRLDAYYPVTAGAHTFYLNGLVQNATDIVQFFYAGLMATFEPN